MSSDRSTVAFLYVVGGACLVDLAMDTPWRSGQWIGPFFQLTPATQLTSATCATALALLTCLLLFARSPGPGDGSRAHSRWPALVPVVAMVYLLLWARVFVGTTAALPWNVMAVGAPLFLCVCAAVRTSPLPALAAVLVVGLTVRRLIFAKFGVDEGADMLPLTEAALANFLRGASPYASYDLPGPVPLTYLPLTWLAYLPLYVARIDIRWTNVVAELALLAAILFAARGQ